MTYRERVQYILQKFKENNKCHKVLIGM